MYLLESANKKINYTAAHFLHNAFFALMYMASLVWSPDRSDENDAHALIACARVKEDKLSSQIRHSQRETSPI